VLGATSDAKRIAAAHVTFNLVTAVVVLALLPLLLWLVEPSRPWAGPGAGPAATLALFHSLFNVLGVVLMMPLTGLLVRTLQGRFVSAEEDEARPRYLDRNVVTTPLLALDALVRELGRLGGVARDMLRNALSGGGETRIVGREHIVVERLVAAIGEFVAEMQRGVLPAELARRLADALRVSRYYVELAELAAAVAAARPEVRVAEPQVQRQVREYETAVDRFLDLTDVRAATFDPEAARLRLERLEGEYQSLKATVLQAGAQGRLAVRTMVELLDVLSNVRRAAGQAFKAARYLHGLQPAPVSGPTPPAGAGDGSADGTVG